MTRIKNPFYMFYKNQQSSSNILSNNAVVKSEVKAHHVMGCLRLPLPFMWTISVQIVCTINTLTPVTYHVIL